MALESLVIRFYLIQNASNEYGETIIDLMVCFKFEPGSGAGGPT